jgi:poly(3-hydroxybutyrate) depolymerase
MARDLGFLSWEDPLAGLEDHNSSIFHFTCQQENKWHSELMEEPYIKNIIKESQPFKEYLKKNRTIKKYFRSGDFKFDVDAISGSVKVHLPGLKDPIEVNDFTISQDGEYIGIIVDNSEGKETLTLQVYKVTKTNTIIQWQHEDVGDSIGFLGGSIAYTIGKEFHIHNELVLASPTNKADRKKIFKVLPTESLHIIQTKVATFLLVNDYVHSKVYKIGSDGLEVIHNVGLQDQIIGGADIIYHDSPTNTYKSVAGIPLPPPSERPLWYSAKHGLVQTISDGVQKIWSIAPGTKPRVLLNTQVPGKIQVDPFAFTADAPYLRFVMRCVDREPVLGTISRTEVRMAAKPAANGMYFPRLQITKITGTSADGEKVPGIILKPKGQTPTNLLVYCYGSYGHPTSFTAAYQVYWPLLETGRWAIAFTMARGGGDRSYEWIHAGRKLKRKHTVDDYEAIIKAAQEELNIGPSKTALYGRSAGGIPVGMMIARHPRRSLAAAAWLEAPFVDILRTMTDMTQPLSVLELEEFGNPAEGPAEFIQIAKQSPINNLPENGVSMNVILRTGENDKQVYAYEPMKFAQRLRGAKTPADIHAQKSPAGIYLFCGKKEGHFYNKSTAFDARIEDMAALDFWLSSV